MIPKPPPPPELQDLDRLARTLRVTKQWLKGEAEAGRIPCLRAGTRYLFSLGAVSQALVDRAAQNEGRADDDQ